MIENNKSKMFGFISKCWNPLGGACPHRCKYCWAMMMASRNKMKKYQGPPVLDKKALDMKFKDGDFVFVQDMSDLFAETVDREMIDAVVRKIYTYPNVKFLLMTKNPGRYYDVFVHSILDGGWGSTIDNIILGTTIETDLTYGEAGCRDMSLAPSPNLRLRLLSKIHFDMPLFISIEPVLPFSRNFISALREVSERSNLWGVAVGYENWNNHLPEPKLEDTLELIEGLEKFTMVHKKTIRKGWWEQ